MWGIYYDILSNGPPKPQLHIYSITGVSCSLETNFGGHATTWTAWWVQPLWKKMFVIEDHHLKYAWMIFFRSVFGSQKKLFCWSWLLLHLWISMAKRLGDYINLNYPSKIGDEIVTDWRKKNIRGIGVAAFCSLFATGYLQNLLISLSYKHPRTEGKISKKQRTFL